MTTRDSTEHSSDTAYQPPSRPIRCVCHEFVATIFMTSTVTATGAKCIFGGVLDCHFASVHPALIGMV